MNANRILLGIAVLTPLGLGAFARPDISPSTPEGAEYSIDTTHSSVIFKVKHMSASWFYGRFNGITGQIVADEKDPSQSSVLFTIDAGSVDSGNGKLDEHIRNADFLDAKQFPEIIFESETVKKGKGGALEVEGSLTLRGVTKPLSVTVEKVGASEMRGKKVGYHTSFTIDRTEFGVSYDPDGKGVGKEIELIISVEANG